MKSLMKSSSVKSTLLNASEQLPPLVVSQFHSEFTFISPVRFRDQNDLAGLSKRF